jgi:hypothetical protein
MSYELKRVHWNSPAEYCAAAAKILGVENYDHSRGLDSTFDNYIGGFNATDAAKGINLIRTGKHEGSDLVEQYMHEVMQNLPSFSRQWTMDVAGHMPNVPAFLAGDPASMWNIHTEQSDNTPLRIWVNTLPSAANTAEQIYMRGAAICALALILQQKRSVVRISPYADLGAGDTETGSMCSYDLTMPLSTSELLAALADDSTRILSYFVNRATNYTGSGWVLGHCPTQSNYSDALCKKHLNAGSDDIVVPAIHGKDVLLKDPIAWIRHRLEPYMTGEMYA